MTQPGVLSDLIISGTSQLSKHVTSPSGHSFFRHSYFSYAKFVTCTDTISLNQANLTNNKVTTLIPNDVDLVANLYLHAELPSLSIDDNAVADADDNGFLARSAPVGCFASTRYNGHNAAQAGATELVFTFAAPDFANGETVKFYLNHQRSVTVEFTTAASTTGTAFAAVDGLDELNATFTCLINGDTTQQATNFTAAYNAWRLAHNIPTSIAPVPPASAGAVSKIRLNAYGNELVTKVVEDNDSVAVTALYSVGAVLDGTAVSVHGGTGLNAISYVEHVGYKMIRSCTLKVQNQQIARITGDYLLAHSEISGGATPAHTLAMTGGAGQLRCGDPVQSLLGANANKVNIYVPLQFYFSGSYHTALPLVAMQYNNVQLELELEPLANLIVVTNSLAKVTFNEATTGTVRTKAATSYNTDVPNICYIQEGIYLSDAEREVVAGLGRGPVRRLIEQTQEYEEDLVPGRTTYNIKPNFNFLVKAFIVTFHDKMNDASARYTTHEAVQDLELKINSNVRFGSVSSGITGFSGDLFSSVVPYLNARRVPTAVNNVYVMSHALDCSRYQPSGALNASKIQNINFTVTFPTAPLNTITMKVIAVNYNQLVTDNGTGGIVFHS